jgi:hypothetical protein
VRAGAPRLTRASLGARAARGLAAGAWLAAGAACATPGRLGAPAERFRTATEATNAAVLAYLADANRVQRAARFAEAAADSSLAVTDALYLRPVFSDEGVAARAAALDLVAAYAARLSALAGARRNQPLAAASKELGAQLTALGTTAGGADAGLARYAGPLASLAGAVGELWAERRRERALGTLVPRAAPAVDRVLALLADDLALAARQRRLGADGRWRALAAAYNTRRLRDAPAERARRLAELQAAADAYGADRAPAPAAALAAMRSAHAALVRAAAAGGRPSADVLGAVELFAERARQARALADAFGTARPAAP